MAAPRILSVGLAVPANAVRQEDLKSFAAALFATRLENLERLLPVFDNANIAVRHLAQPLEWYAATHSFAETSLLYEQTGLALAEEAAIRALDRAGLTAKDIEVLLLVSSTGVATPTLDAKLIQRLGFSPHTTRLPVWGLGCAGGVAGLARAAELAQGRSRPVLLVAVELCSLTFQRNDFSKSNLVGAGLFADGAAAVVVGNGGEGPELLGSHSTLFSDTEDIMGWDMVDTGFKVRFSRDIPNLVRRFLPDLLGKACTSWQVSSSELHRYVVHPGGVKVLEAYAESLGLQEKTLTAAYDILGRYGNMSSASVLFVLEQVLATERPSGAYGVMLALGPGFSAEQVLFRW